MAVGLSLDGELCMTLRPGAQTMNCRLADVAKQFT
jgi:hypothetical protein